MSNINELDTGKVFKIIETSDASKIPFEGGQYIIVDNGLVYYDPTYGTSISDRRCLVPKQEVDTFDRTDDNTDQYYLDLCKNPIDDDMVIIRTPIANTSKYDYKVYVYNGGKWNAISGEYTAENVYFTEDLTVTTQVGNIELVDGKAVIPNKGKNLKETLEMIYGGEKFPTITNPSINVTLTNSGCYEIGTKITPAYTTEFDEGLYEFGPETGVKLGNLSVRSSTGVTKSSATGSFAQITVNENTEFYVTATATHAAGVVPKTAMNNDYRDGKIAAGTVTGVSEKITGYIEGFYHGVSNNLIDASNVTSNIIRGLDTTKQNYTNGSEYEMIVPMGAKSIIFAVPNSNDFAIEKVYNNTALCDMTYVFGTPIVKNVYGANNSQAHAYKIYIYSPAEPYENETHLKITLK